MNRFILLACAGMVCSSASAAEYNVVESRQTYGTAKIIELTPVNPGRQVEVWTDQATNCRYAVLDNHGQQRLQLLPSLGCENSRTVKIR